MPIAKADAFTTGGYTLLCLRLIEQSLRDLRAKDEAIVAAAKTWFDPVMGRDAGVKFEDCVYSLGWASRVDAIRRMVVENPEKLLKAIEYAIATACSDGVSRRAESQSIIPTAEEILDQPPVSPSNAFSLLHRALFATPA